MRMAIDVVCTSCLKRLKFKDKELAKHLATRREESATMTNA